MKTSIHRFRSFSRLASLLALAALASSDARAFDNKFTYQGRLTDGAR